MSLFYANITLSGPEQSDVAAYLTRQGVIAYVSPTVKGATIVFHAEMGDQENIATALSTQFDCPALLVMVYGDTILLYQLYQSGERTDSYVSSPHEDLDMGNEPTPEGDAGLLCAAFGMERRQKSVERVLRRPTKPGTDYAHAANRHGELARALGLPVFGVGISFRDIEMGELPAGPGFDPAALVRTGL